MDFSRRRFTGWLLALLFGSRRASGEPEVQPTLRRYRADAAVLVLGVPIYKRAGVGTGQVSVEPSGKGPEAGRTLFFAAGSDPKRAHGLARLGWMRETARINDSAPEIDYFGVLTSSPEESLDSIHKTIAAPPSGSSLFAAVSGRHTRAHTRSALAQFEYSSDAPWSDRGLIEKSQSEFASGSAWRENSRPKWPDRPPPTFLFQLEALLKQRAKASGTYIYNEQEYLLELGAPDHLLAIKGSIRNQRTGNNTTFRVWLEKAPDSVIPIRIEFQPRSFLRLTFEAVQS